MLKFFCSRCDNPFVLQESLAGRKGKCPKCGVKFRIPDRSGEDPVIEEAGGDIDLLPDEPRPTRPVTASPPTPRAGSPIARPPSGVRPGASLPFQPPEPILPASEPAPAAAGANKVMLGVGIGGGLALVLAIGIFIGSGKGPEESPLERTRRPANSEPAASATETATPERKRLTPSEIMEQYALAVVRVQTTGEGGKEQGLGSGFVVDAAGVVVTNFHVIDGAESVQVQRKDGTSFGIEGVLAFDAKLDFAVLKVSAGGEPWRTVALGDSDKLASGSRVVTLGHSLGLNYTLSDGLFSGKNDPGQALGDPMGLQYLQISAPISPGNSGGPLFDEYGEVVGVNTMCIVGPTAQNLNFALPINDVKAKLGETALHSLPDVVAEGRKRSVADLLRTGNRYLQDRDRMRAFLTFKAAYEREPGNAAVVLGYAEALSLVGQYHLAREKCEEALKLSPGSARALRTLGQSYHATGDRGRALLALRRALAAEPDDPTVQLNLALLLSGWKRSVEAVTLAERALAKPTEDPELLFSGLVAFARAGEGRKAEDLLDRFPKGPERERLLRIGKGFIALESGRFADASELLARAVEAEPGDPRIRLAYAEALQGESKWEQAIAEYKACLELEETLYPALKGLARLYDGRGLWMEALGLYRVCVKLSPSDLEANLRLSQILRDLGHADESIPFLKAALDRSPGYRPCVLALAQAYAAAGQRDKASDMLAPLAQTDPPDPQARIALAEVYLDQGRAKDATALLLQVRAGGELLARKLFLYARALEAAENFAAAATAMDEAVSVAPERGEYRFMRGALYARFERRSARGALFAYLDWAANREEEAQRRTLAQQMLDQMR